MPPSRRRPPPRPNRPIRVAGSRRAGDRPADPDTRPADAVDDEPAAPDTPEVPATADTPATGHQDPPTQEPAEPPASTPAPTGQPTPPHRSGPRRAGLLLPAALAVVAVTLGSLAVLAGLKAHHLRSSATAHNTALTDNARTSQVSGQITSAVNTIFSYNYTDLAKTQRAAQKLLTGQAICQYNDLFAAVRQQAPRQKLVVTTTVTNTGVETLHENRARVLVFATQSDTRTTTNQTATAGAMFAVDATLRDGQWKIENIDTFTGDHSSQDCR